MAEDGASATNPGRPGGEAPEEPGSGSAPAESNGGKGMAKTTPAAEFTYEVALDSLFGVERVNHGDPDEPFVWEWPKQDQAAALQVAEAARCPLRLHLANGSVHLMAQHVWQSALTLSEEMVRAKVDVRGKHVLELGAGAALPGLVARRLGAASVVISDYPEPEIVENMERNVRENQLESDCPVQVRGFKWGTDVRMLVDCIPGDAQMFDVVLMADTLWLENQHHNLLKSCRDLMLHPSCKRESFRLVFTFMNHDDGRGVAGRFFQLAETQYGMKILERRTLAWREARSPFDDPEESDASDPERYGPVYLRVLGMADEGAQLGDAAAAEAAFAAPPSNPEV